MIKEIPLKGITTTPDNYLSKDGDLQYALNCASQDGSLTTPPRPSVLLYVPEDYELLYVHETGSYTNYIFWNEHTQTTTKEDGTSTTETIRELLFSGAYTTDLLNNSKSYADAKYAYENASQTDKAAKLTIMNTYANNIKYYMANLMDIALKVSAKPTAITSIGNMLCLTNSNGLQYCLCTDGLNYKILPARFPRIHATSALSGEFNIMRNESSIKISNRPTEFDSQYLLFSTLINDNLDDISAMENHETTYYMDFPATAKMKQYGAGIYKFVFTPDDSIRDEDSTEHVPALFIEWQYAKKDENGNYTKWTTIENENEYPFTGEWNGKNMNGLVMIATCTASIRVPEVCDCIRAKVKGTTGYWTDYFKNTENWKCSVDIYTEFTQSYGYTIVNDSENDSYLTISAAAKKFINQFSTSKSRFIYPFFVRYAFKTQDNHYICPTAPVLLIPNAGQCPMVRCSDTTGSESNVSLLLSAVVSDLYTKFSNYTDYSNWTDIISKVVIAISSPIYSYNQSIENAEELKSQIYLEEYTNDSSRFCLGSKNGSNHKTDSEYSLFNDHSTYTLKRMLHLPQYDSPETKIEENSDFYIVKEIPLQDIINGDYDSLKKIDLSGISFDSLKNERVLPDDFSSLMTYMPKNLYSLNNRLHIANYEQQLFEGWEAEQMCQYDEKTKVGDQKYYYKSYVTIRQDNTTYVVESKLCKTNNNFGDIRYFSYPNINAVTAEIHFINISDTTKIYKVTIPLKTHPIRNESYWFNNFKTIQESFTKSQLDQNDPHYIEVRNDFDNNGTYTISYATAIRPNFVKISETNNPLIFTDLRTYNFNSPVAALTSAVTALSTGQKGDFDLYVFTESDGVWSLKINSEGGYSKQIPVTRDTITNPKSICQLDSSVLFVTDRGIMELHGSDSQCISEDLMRKETIALVKADLPLINKLLQNDSSLGLYNATNQDGISPDPLDFRTYIQNAHISYDYRNQRIVVFNPSKSYAYNFNVKSKLWTLIPSTFSSPVNSYPECLIQTKDELVIDLSGNSTTDNKWYSVQQPSFILTRPFSLDLPNEFKIIDQLRINGTGYLQDIGTGRYDSAGNLIITPSHINQILYGSNDLLTWHCISSSKTGRISGKSGTPYRFFRLAILSSLTASETIDSISISYRIKDENTKLF